MNLDHDSTYSPSLRPTPYLSNSVNMHPPYYSDQDRSHIQNNLGATRMPLISSMSIESSDSSSYVSNQPHAGGSTSWSSSLESDWNHSRVGDNHLAMQLQASRQENIHLTKLIGTWQTKFETLQTAYNLLLERVTGPRLSVPQRLDPKDYPNIRYWYKHQWTSSTDDSRITDISDLVKEDDNEDEELVLGAPEPEAHRARRGQGRSRAGINVAMLFIQRADGQVIDGHRAREIRIHARSVFVGFALNGKLFSSWGDADAESRTEYYSRMYNRFEELQYCDLDWKAEQIATDTFPGWKSTWIKKHGKGKKLSKKPLHEDTDMDPVDQETSDAIEIKSLVTTTLPVPDAPPSHSDSSEHHQPIPLINIISSTPAKPTQTPEHMVMEAPNSTRPFTNTTFLRPAFQINNPFSLSGDGNIPQNASSQLTYPSRDASPRYQPQLSLDTPGSKDLFSQTQRPAEAPAKRARTGGGKMRPTKSSTTPRNLCAQTWVISNPKGTTEEFAAYYDGLSPEEKQVWENQSAQRCAEAKKGGNQ